MKKVYKVLEKWHGEYSAHYNVKVVQNERGCFESLRVRNNSIGLTNTYRGTVECTIFTAGEDYIIKTENHEFMLDICEIHAVRAALLALYEAEGGSTHIKLKNKGCTCGG